MKIRTRLINDQVGIFIDDQALDDALSQLESAERPLAKPESAVESWWAKMVLREPFQYPKRDARTDINFYKTLQVVDIETLQISDR